MFTNSTAHVQRKETGIQGMLFSALEPWLNRSNGLHKYCMCYGRLARAPLEMWKCLFLTIGWNFSAPCRPIANLRAWAYRLK